LGAKQYLSVVEGKEVRRQYRVSPGYVLETEATQLVATTYINVLDYDHVHLGRGDTLAK
jgi:hypothetical protein